MDRSRTWRTLGVVFVVLLLAACGGAGSGAATTSPDQLKALTANLGDAVAKLKANDVAGAKASFQTFNDDWAKIEDGVKAKNKDGYAKIESGITDVKAALTVPATPDAKKAIAALEQLDSTVDDVVPTLK